MLSAVEAQQRILERISPLDPLELSITDAHGSVLAETVSASEDLPPYPSAASDGFALRSADTANASASPVSLTIIGEAAVGRPFAARVTHGEAVRVAAGAALPDGTDTVTRKEDVAVVGSSMAIGSPIKAGNNVRPAGEDVRKGDPIMQEGQRMRGMDVGVLAALGRVRVLVRPRPRVVTFSAGEQLAEPGHPASEGAIRESNSFAMGGMVREAGAEPTRGGIVAPDADALRERFQSYLPQADVFLTTGGLSDRDAAPVRLAADLLGDIDVWTISCRPDVVIAFGNIHGRPLFALPENPVGATLAFELFVRPALLKMAGRRTITRSEVVATMDDSHDQRPGRETYLRLRAWREESGWRARLAGRQGPSVISSVAGANALGILPADKGYVQTGDEVRLLLLEPLEGW
jgi:molybdopterin molybdotransferase